MSKNVHKTQKTQRKLIVLNCSVTIVGQYQYIYIRTHHLLRLAATCSRRGTRKREDSHVVNPPALLFFWKYEWWRHATAEGVLSTSLNSYHSPRVQAVPWKRQGKGRGGAYRSHHDLSKTSTVNVWEVFLGRKGAR